jgi:hypothetical protein
MMAIVGKRKNLKYADNNVVPAIYSGSGGILELREKYVQEE